jgi:hypothetical protein
MPVDGAYHLEMDADDTYMVRLHLQARPGLPSQMEVRYLDGLNCGAA